MARFSSAAWNPGKCSVLFKHGCHLWYLNDPGGWGEIEGRLWLELEHRRDTQELRLVGQVRGAFPQDGQNCWGNKRSQGPSSRHRDRRGTVAMKS